MVKGVDNYYYASTHISSGTLSRFRGILFHQNAYFTLMLRKKLQLSGTSSPAALPGLCPWTPLGDFRPHRPLLCPPTMETDRRLWLWQVL